jgi:hypothetical protein
MLCKARRHLAVLENRQSSIAESVEFTEMVFEPMRNLFKQFRVDVDGGLMIDRGFVDLNVLKVVDQFFVGSYDELDKEVNFYLQVCIELEDWLRSFDQ